MNQPAVVEKRRGLRAYVSECFICYRAVLDKGPPLTVVVELQLFLGRITVLPVGLR